MFIVLDYLKSKLSRSARKSFNERFIDYMLQIQDTNLVLEMEYIEKHNNLDVFKLNKVIAKMIEGSIDDNRKTNTS